MSFLPAPLERDAAIDRLGWTVLHLAIDVLVGGNNLIHRRTTARRLLYVNCCRTVLYDIALADYRSRIVIPYTHRKM
jgi:hypothetical protein